MYQQKFINRERELSFLEEKHQSKKPELIVIYGRRRVGKSELLIKFLKSKGIYFLCSTEGDRENISKFQEKISEFFKDPALKELKIEDWRKLFSFMFSNNKVVEYTKKNKLAICVDEFPFLIKANNNIPSIFQQVWEESLKNKNVMILLTGSFISIMESSVLAYQSPLYGRSTGIWRLTPLDFKHLKDFFPEYKIEDLIKVWCILGGVPYYLLKFSKDTSLQDNIKNSLLRKGESLFREVELILNEEFREPRNYKLILKTISQGKQAMNELVNSTGLDKSMVSKYLEVLKSTGIIRETIPIGKSSNFRKRLYSISDQFFNFWFKYIYPNLIDLEANFIEEVFERINKDLNSYFGRMFEQFIEEILKGKSVKLNFTKIGKWWYKDKEIDLIAINENTKEVFFIECKWQNNVEPNKIFEELKEKSKYFEWNNDERKEKYLIFAKSFKEKKENCYDLKDIANIFI